jgi:hypothetical protein
VRRVGRGGGVRGSGRTVAVGAGRGRSCLDGIVVKRFEMDSILSPLRTRERMT